MFPSRLPLLLVFSNPEDHLRCMAETLFDLKHRLPFWLQAQPGTPAFSKKIRESMTSDVNLVLEISIQPAERSADLRVILSNHGNEAAESRLGQPLTCEPSLLRDFRDVAAAVFADTSVIFEFNRAGEREELGLAFLAEGIPWIRIILPEQLLKDENSLQKGKRFDRLSAHLESWLAMFCKVEAWH